MAELLSRGEQLQTALTGLEQTEKEKELRLAEENSQLSLLRETLHARVLELETELRHANEMLEKAGVGRRGLFQSEARLESITEMYSKYVEATNRVQDLEEENSRVVLNLETYKNAVNEKIPLLRRQKEENDFLRRSTQELKEQLESAGTQLEKLSYDSDASIRRSQFLERENAKLSSTIRELNTQVCVLLKESEESRGVSVSSSSLPPESGDALVSSSSEGRVISFRSLEELQSRNVELMRRVRDREEELERAKGVSDAERVTETQRRVEELTQLVERVKESKKQQSDMVQSILQDRDRYKSLLAQATPLPLESTRVASEGDASSPSQLQELQAAFDNHKGQSEEIRKQLLAELTEVKEAKSRLELEIDRLDSKLEFASERQELLKNWYESQRGESQGLREKNDKLVALVGQLEQNSRELMQEQFETRDKLSRLEFQKEDLEKRNEVLRASEDWSKKQIESLHREKHEQKLLRANIEMIQNSLERSELETKARASQQAGLLEGELRHTHTQLEHQGKQHARVVEAWERQVDELKTSLTTTQDTHTQTVAHQKNQGAKIKDLESVLSLTHSKLEQKEREVQEARDNLRKAESGDMVLELQEQSTAMKLRIAELENSCQALSARVSSANEHVERYKGISTAAEEELKGHMELSEVYRREMEEKLREGDDRQEELKEQMGELERGSDQLRGKLERTETAHSAGISKLDQELEYLRGLLRELQASVATMEEKEAQAREDAALQASISQETQEKYEREVVEHGRTVEGMCKAKDELQTLSRKLREVELQSEQHLFKLRESAASWEEVKRLQEERIEGLSTQLTDAQAQNKLLFSQLESINAKLITLQSQKELAEPGQEGSLPLHTFLTADESEDQLRELIRHIRRDKEIMETKFELAESERARLSEVCQRCEKELKETRAALAGEQEALRAQADNVAQHTKLLEKVNTLNLLQESNRVLREDKTSLEKSASSLSSQLKERTEELMGVRESCRTLTSQRETLLAEKTALKNEVARWQARVNQLMEVYDKVDPEEFRELQGQREEHLHRISGLEEKVKLGEDERMEQKRRVKLLEERIGQLQSEGDGRQERHDAALKEAESKLAEKETELKGRVESCTRFARAARSWKTKFEEKNSQCQEAEKKLRDQDDSNQLEKSRSEEEWQERQQELQERNRGLEEESSSLQEQLSQTRAALEEKSVKMDKTQEGLRKLSIQMRQKTKGLEEKISSLKGETAQLKVANADKESHLQALKNQHLSEVSALEAKLKLESSSKVSSTQPSTGAGNVSAGKSQPVAAIKPSKQPTIPAILTTLPVVAPMCRDTISVSVPPFTSSFVTSSAQPSSLLGALHTVTSDLSKYASAALKQGEFRPTNFNLSQVVQDLGMTTRSGSKRRRMEAEASTTSTPDLPGEHGPKKNKTLTTPPLDSAEGTGLIDSSTTPSPNSTSVNPSAQPDETHSSTSSSRIQSAGTSGEDHAPPAIIMSQLSPPPPASEIPDQSSSRSTHLQLPVSIDQYGLEEQQVPNTPILINQNPQLGHTIPGHSSLGHSVPDSSSITIATDEGLANDHELDFSLNHDIIQAQGNSSQEDNLYGEFPRNSADAAIASPTRILPFSSTADSPSSTPGPQVSTSTHNQPHLSTLQDSSVNILFADAIEEQRDGGLHIQSEADPTSAVDDIPRFDLTDPNEGVTSIEVQDVSDEQFPSSSDEESNRDSSMERDDPITVITSDEIDSYGEGDDDCRYIRKESVELVSEGSIEDQNPATETDPSFSEQSHDISGGEKGNRGQPPKIVKIIWDTPTGAAPSNQPKTARPTTSNYPSKGTGHKGKPPPNL